jgi:hypothetical protein
MKLDVIYPIKNDSKFRDDWELRYSLRSLEQQDWVKDVWLIGHCPKWAKAVIHIPCDDPYPTLKDANIINKIMMTCSAPHLTDYFVVNSDDQYILRPISINDLYPMIEPPELYMEYRVKAYSNTWFKRVVETVNWCRDNGYHDWIFQSHVPYLVNKYDYASAMAKVPWGYNNGFVTHVYLNITIPGFPEYRDPHVEPVGRTIRVKGRQVDVRKLAETATFLNHNDNGLNPMVKAFVEERFPNKSRWEQ